MKWKAQLYYKDPADGQIQDITTFISEDHIYELLYGVDSSILDHLKLVELKPVENY